MLATSRPPQRLAFLLATCAGLRGGEIRGLRWGDINLVAGYLVVRESICHGEAATPKSGHERIVPLVPELRVILSKVLRVRDEFVSLNGWRCPWTERGILQAFQRACVRARD